MKTDPQLERDVHKNFENFDNFDISDEFGYKCKELSVKLGAREMLDLKTSYHADLLSQHHRDKKLFLHLLQKEDGSIPQLFPRGQ